MKPITRVSSTIAAARDRMRSFFAGLDRTERGFVGMLAASIVLTVGIVIAMVFINPAMAVTIVSIIGFIAFFLASPAVLNTSIGRRVFGENVDPALFASAATIIVLMMLCIILAIMGGRIMIAGILFTTSIIAVLIFRWASR